VNVAAAAATWVARESAECGDAAARIARMQGCDPGAPPLPEKVTGTF
jgi:hypothetical protein